MSKPNEPMIGVPYYAGQNPYQARAIPPNVIFGYPMGFRFSRQFTKTLLLLSTVFTVAIPDLPPSVAISGRVGSEISIKSEYSALRGVIVEETVEQHFLKHNDAGSWIQDSASMLSMSKKVPWYLVRNYYFLSETEALGLLKSL